MKCTPRMLAEQIIIHPQIKEHEVAEKNQLLLV